MVRTSQEELLSLIDKQIYVEVSSGFSLKETDVTGDGLPEGIFTGNGGNNDASFILITDSKGEPELAKWRMEDGSVSVVSLLSVGRVAFQEGYVLVPEQQGFYLISKSLDRTQSEFESNFICNPGGAPFFKWNERTELFEWNEELTALYTSEVCP